MLTRLWSSCISTPLFCHFPLSPGVPLSSSSAADMPETQPCPSPYGKLSWYLHMLHLLDLWVFSRSLISQSLCPVAVLGCRSRITVSYTSPISVKFDWFCFREHFLYGGVDHTNTDRFLAHTIRTFCPLNDTRRFTQSLFIAHRLFEEARPIIFQALQWDVHPKNLPEQEFIYRGQVFIAALCLAWDMRTNSETGQVDEWATRVGLSVDRIRRWVEALRNMLGEEILQRVQAGMMN